MEKAKEGTVKPTGEKQDVYLVISDFLASLPNPFAVSKDTSG